MSDWIVDHYAGGWNDVRTPLGPEYLMNDSGQLYTASNMQHTATGLGGASRLGGGGSPLSTLVGSSSGLEIDLNWDASVRGASNWSAIEKAFVQAAEIYTSDFSTHALINIDVGLGEVGGQALQSGALGESESYGYLVNYATVANALGGADAGLVGSGQMASGAVTADAAALSAKTFFVSTAEAKALGLASATSTSLDGYIGLASGSALFYAAGGGTIGAGQYDAVGVAAHEISEVMGRIGMEGASASSGRYTPLDLFRYTAPNVADLTPTAGYFSTNLGATTLNLYNNPTNGGDAADWATTAANLHDAYDAFANPGVTTQVSSTDLLQVAALGYRETGVLSTVQA